MLRMPDFSKLERQLADAEATMAEIRNELKVVTYLLGELVQLSNGIVKSAHVKKRVEEARRNVASA